MVVTGRVAHRPVPSSKVSRTSAADEARLVNGTGRPCSCPRDRTLDGFLPPPPGRLRGGAGGPAERLPPEQSASVGSERPCGPAPSHPPVRTKGQARLRAWREQSRYNSFCVSSTRHSVSADNTRSARSWHWRWSHVAPGPVATRWWPVASGVVGRRLGALQGELAPVGGGGARRAAGVRAVGRSRVFGGIGIRLLTQRDKVRRIARSVQRGPARWDQGGPARWGLCSGSGDGVRKARPDGVCAAGPAR